VDKPPFEVADVIRSLADANGVVPGLCVSTAQQRVLNAVAACRTAKLGGHVEECDAGCGHELIAYNSCGNRHCPKCQARKRAEWLEARRADLLPVAYFHVVFTLTDLIGPLARIRTPEPVLEFIFRSMSASPFFFRGGRQCERYQERLRNGRESSRRFGRAASVETSSVRSMEFGQQHFAIGSMEEGSKGQQAEIHLCA